jgi:hypothetical protein
MHWTIENANYANDSRVRAAGRGDAFQSIDENRMTGTTLLQWFDDDTDKDCEELVEVPIKYEVCWLCSGKGTHVNPSIDCNGLTREDFDADPDFAESYFSGHYDQTCEECHGHRIVPVINHEGVSEEVAALIKRVEEQREEDAKYEAMAHAERMAEIRMGC